jgi:hypothetical protein
MSSLVELYLSQVKSVLPRKRRDGIAAEIRGKIESTIEERERALGRALRDDETGEILKRYGPPIAVAGRYLPAQHLIGPRVFPLYWHVIRATLAVIAGIAGIVSAIGLFTHPYATRSVTQVLVRYFWIALEASAIVTLIFVLLDHAGGLRFLEELDPRRVRRSPLGEISRKDTLLRLVITAILLLWWTGWLAFPTVPASVDVELGSGARALFMPVIALCAVDIARCGADFVLPYRTRPRVGLALAANVAWLVVLALAFSAPDLLQAAPSIEDPAEIERVVAIATRVFDAVILGAGLWAAALAAANVRHLMRR